MHGPHRARKRALEKPFPLTRCSNPAWKNPLKGGGVSCIENKNDKPVCASTFLIQQGQQVCGSWQSLDTGKVDRKGFAQATVESSRHEVREKNARAIAKINFVCGAETYKNDPFAPISCGFDHAKPTWIRPTVELDYRMTICKKTTVITIINSMINESICSINNPPYALSEYHSIDTSNKEKLLNLPWMQ